jgi:enediyne biosynthesis protein E4
VIEATREDVKYKEPPLLLRNTGKGTFENMRESAGPVFRSSYVARGLAIGDFDNDGDTDAVFTTLDGRPVLLRNNLGKENGWIGLELQGTKSDRDAIGAKITVHSGNRRLVRWITGGSSYLASSDNRVIVGLGADSARAIEVDIRWPSGTLQHISRLEPNRYHRIIEPRAAP